MGTFGDTLRHAREDLGASLEDAERETHIHRRYLEALEAEDRSALPGPVYERGFIRTYSQFLGLNPDAMLDLLGSRPPAEQSPTPRPIPAQLQVPRPISVRPVIVLGVVVMAGLLAAYLWSQYNSFVESLSQVEQVPSSRSATPTAAPTRPVAAAASPSPDAVASPSPPALAASPSPVPTPARGLVVEARIVERSWLEVFVDGRREMSETVNPGFSRVFTAEQQVRMRVGNAAGVQAIVNGVSQGSLGPRGQAIDAVWGRQ
jgi:cytoskeleton protein RodZ